MGEVGNVVQGLAGVGSWYHETDLLDYDTFSLDFSTSAGGAPEKKKYLTTFLDI